MIPNTPASILPILLLLRPSAMPGPGGILTLATAKNCHADYNITKADDWGTINKVLNEKYGMKYVQVYVHPEQGFKGVMITMKIGNSDYNSWVSLPEYCFFPKISWWWMVEAMVLIDRSSNIINKLILHLKTGNCFAECVREDDISSTPMFFLMAHGTSQWRREEPEDQESCPTMRAHLSHPNLDCSDDPPMTSPPSSLPFDNKHKHLPLPSGYSASIASTSSPGEKKKEQPIKLKVADVVAVIMVLLLTIGVQIVGILVMEGN